MQRNAKGFNYPTEGFETPIEQSLLYSMIAAPEVYPQDVVQTHIMEEDFDSYLTVKTKKENEEPRVSYAQLSAMLALAAENFPPPENDESNKDDQQQSIAEVLVKRSLKCIIRYAEVHGLDREAEVQELLHPVRIQSIKRSNQAGLKHVLPLYVGYTASILTANPLPVLIGLAISDGMEKSSGMREEEQNVSSISKTADRTSDVEKTSLLDEAEEDW
jgi:hypothetical protein